MRFGIQQKVLAVLTGALVLNALLGALLASYYTNRQNEEAAFAALGNDLVAWQSDLTTAAKQHEMVALATVSDTVVLTQLTEMMAVEDAIADPAKAEDRLPMLKSLSFRKTASLNRLELALRTGRFDSIAVHTHGRLSHAVSTAQVGMSVQRAPERWAWIAAAVDERGETPFSTWPAWPDAPPPAAEAAYHATPRAPEVNVLFEPGQDATIQIAVPVQGLASIATTDMTDHGRNRRDRVYAEVRVAGLASAPPPALNADDLKTMAPDVFAVVVFRKRIDRSVLNAFARHSGKLPALFSPDGMYRQSLAPDAVFSPELVRQAAGTATTTSPAVLRRTVDAASQSFYASLQPWQFDGQTRMVMGLATPQSLTLQNVRQTVRAILGASSAVLLLSLAVGLWWARRTLSPIVQLTASVQAVSSFESRPRGNGSGPSLAPTLRPADLAAPDEVGDLARAFHTMVAKLQRSFDTLEQQVQDRTAELRQRERYLRTLIDTLPMRAWLKDAQSRYLVVNELLARDCGRTVSDMTGKPDADLFPPAVAEQHRAADLETMASRAGRSIEQRAVELGADTWRETYLAPVVDEDGSVLGIVGVARDITDRKAVEAARESALAEARHLATQRSDFLARMSHELRTPLNGILGFAQILRQGGQLSTFQARGLAIIEDSGNHLLKLITDILDLARVDAGRLDLRPEEADLPALLHGVCDLVRVHAEEKQLCIQVEVDDDVPTGVRLDKQRLRQVLLNLLSNAVKFTDAGEVTLRVQRLLQAPRAPHRVDAEAAASARVRFEVQDSGIGLTPQQIQRMFQPFEQFGDDRHREAGSGLGLAISQQIVRLMGGEIKVDSTPGGGSRFHFELEAPIVSRAPVAQPPRPSKSPVGYAGRRRRVLVVDDVQPNRAVLIGLLGMLGFDTAEAEDGVQALEVTARWQPDLIVMDLMMPGMDGFEAIRRLRRQPESTHLPIVAASASATAQTERESRDAGADAFIVKPIQWQALVDVLGTVLGLNWLSKDA